MRWFARLPWPVAVTAVFIASRIVSTVILLATARQQPAGPWSDGEVPPYTRFVATWDAEWYERIFNEGYPNAIPRGEDGRAQENAWAFLPLFPMIVRGVALVTSTGWNNAASAVAVLCGLAAALCMYPLFRRMLSHTGALWAVAIVLFSPLGALFQIPYAEGLHLALLALILFCLATRRFTAAIPLILLAGFARPAAAPMALAVLLVAVYWLAPSRRQTLGHNGAVALLGALMAAALSAVLWPVLAWATTGEATAYTETETVWRGGDLHLFKPWADRAEFLFGPWWPLACLVAVGLLVWLFAGRALRRTGVAVWSWCLAYVLYMAAVFDPQTSTFRLLLPLFPLAALAASGGVFSRITPAEEDGAPTAGGRGVKAAASEHSADLRAMRILWIVFGVCGQIVWVYWLWRWTPLPGGGDYPP